MKKSFKISTVITTSLVFTAVMLASVYLPAMSPRFVGMTGPDGDVLKKYMEPAELKKITEKPDESIWIIDVRPENAYSKGHIPTAKSFSSGTIMSRLDAIPRDKYLIVYCETGGRAQAVINKLADKGYTRYMNWGGFYRWKYDRATGDR